MPDCDKCDKLRNLSSISPIKSSLCKMERERKPRGQWFIAGVLKGKKKYKEQRGGKGKKTFLEVQ